MFYYRIVRNKAAEKAKHVHHQQQAQQCQQSSGGPTGGSAGGNGGSNGTSVTGNGGSAASNAEITGNVSVIIHSGAVHSQQQHPSQTQLTPGSGGGERTGGYSINGILGIQHTTDPNGNSIKRKRIDGKFLLLSNLFVA